MKKFIAIIVGLFILYPAALWACSPSFCHYRVKAVQHYAAPAVFHHDYYPTYFIAYDAKADALLRELRGIRKDLQSLRQAGVARTGLEVLQQRCAACHGADVAAKAGDDFVLLDKNGKLAPLSYNEKKKAAKKMSDAGPTRMPPPPHPALTPEEKALVEKLFNGDGE